MDESTLKVVTFRDLTDKKDVTVKGTGRFYIGLTTAGEIDVQRSEDELCITLFCLTVERSGGCLLAPINRDLVCTVNSEDEMCSEINLLDGTKFEIADKILVFVNGPIMKQHRKLPPTPSFVVDTPPAKPVRVKNIPVIEAVNQPDFTDLLHESEVSQNDNDEQLLETSFCMLDLPEIKQDMFQDLVTDEQICILSASHFLRQLQTLTDANISTQMLDNIFRLFTDPTEHIRQVCLDYLADVTQASQHLPKNARVRTNHWSEVRFLAALLKQSFDPVSRVILILDLLHVFSHVDANMETMVQCQATSAVLGSMMAYPDVIDLQQYGIDILARIAKQRPILKQKAALREVAIDVVIRAVKCHGKHLSLARAACRVLANISCTLLTVLNMWLDSESSTCSDIVTSVETCEALLAYVFQEGIPEAQSLLKNFNSDTEVNTEGRRFIYYYAKLPQLKLKKSKWLKMKDDNSDISTSDDSSYRINVAESYNASTRHLLICERNEEEPQSILKKLGTFEVFQTSVEKLAFVEDDTHGVSNTEFSESESDCQTSLEDNLKTKVRHEQEFSVNVVKHLVKKTINRRSQKHADDTDSSLNEEDDEILKSLNLRADRSDSPNESNILLTGDNVKADDQNLRCHETNHFKYNESLPFANVCFEERSSEQISENMQTDTEEMVTITSEETSELNLYIKNSHKLEPPIHKAISMAGDSSEKLTHSGSIIVDVPFMDTLVRTQILAHIGSLVFQGDDCKVLMIIDQPIRNLLTDSQAPSGILDYANNQYAANITLMDLEPAIVINVIDAVRYRSVTKDLVVSAILNLTKSITADLHEQTVHTLALFFKALFSNNRLTEIFSGDDFRNEFSVCFQKATEKIQNCRSIEELRQGLASFNLST